MIKKIIRNGLLVSLAFAFAGCADSASNVVVSTPKSDTKKMDTMNTSTTKAKIDVSTSKMDTNKISSYRSNGLSDDKVRELAIRLLKSSRLSSKDLGNIAITAFVDLHQLNKTTSFGRSIAEGMFDELFIRGFNVVDFRGQTALSVNADGEFFITRDVKKMKESVNNTYVLVGTYNYIDGNVILNARIIDNISGVIVATSKTFYKTTNCELMRTCPKPIVQRKIRITTDNCSFMSCPK